MRILVKSSTGKIHAGSSSLNGANCSSGNRGMRVKAASDKEVNSANETSFCGKCFPSLYDIEMARKGVCPQ